MKIALSLLIFGAVALLVAPIYGDAIDWTPLEIPVSRMSASNSHTIQIPLSGRHELLVKIPGGLTSVIPSQISTQMELTWDDTPPKAITSIEPHSTAGPDRYYFISFLAADKPGAHRLKISKLNEIESRFPHGVLELHLFPEHLKTRLIRAEIMQLAGYCSLVIALLAAALRITSKSDRRIT